MRSVAEIFRSYAVFNAEGKHVNGTDKMSNHNYGDAYEQLFPDRAAVRYMMEVGIADGSSLLAWSEIFPNALCVGMDIHHSDKAYGNRIEFFLGDQRVRTDCERATEGRMFDVIVEDATHKIGNTLLTLYWMWPFVKPGGLYIVEEWDGGGGDVSRIQSLWPQAKVVNTQGPFGGIEPLVVFRKPL